MRFLVALLLCFASLRATEIIGSESLQTLPASVDYSSLAVNTRPGDGETVDLNPPKFSWTHTFHPERSSLEVTVKTFRFQISPNSNMSSPVVNVVTESNCYNRLAPLTAGNTYYWQVEYRAPVTVDNSTDFITWTQHGMSANDPVTVSGTAIPTGLAADTTYYVRDVFTNAFKLAATAGGAAINITSDGTAVKVHQLTSIRSFTVANDATTWDRSFLADEDWYSGLTHPYMLFNSSNRAAVKAVVDDLPEWNTWVNQADTAIAAGWWNTDPVPGTLGRSVWADYILKVAFVYQMTQSATYSDADPEVSLVLLAEQYMDSEAVIQDRIFDSESSGELIALSFGYDWLYDLMDSTQRATVLNALYVRCRFGTCNFCFKCDADSSEGGAFYADITGAYTEPLKVSYPMVPKWGSSHNHANFYDTMLPALAGLNDSAGCREFFELGIDYIISSTWPYGSWGIGSGHGRGYNLANLFTDTACSYFPMLMDVSFPESEMYKNPFWTEVAHWWDRAIPVKWANAVLRDPFGDGGTTGGLPNNAWANNPPSRNLAWFTQDGRARTHYDNQLAFTYSGVQRPNVVWEAPFHYYYSMPTGVTSYPKSQLFNESGWVMGSSMAPNHTDAFTDGVGFVFCARPAGGKGSHDYYCDGHVDIWGYGGNVTDGGNGLDPYGHLPWAMNVVTMNGIGTHMPAYSPYKPYYSKIIAYKETADYVYFAADLTEAFGSEAYSPGAIPAGSVSFYDTGDAAAVTKWHRHVLFMKGKYFIMWDDLDAASPVTWSWIWHIAPDTISGSPTSTFNYTVPGDGGNVGVYVQHIGTGLGLDAIHQSTTDVGTNPFTGEDYYDIGFGLYIAVWDDAIQQKHVMWINSDTTETAFHFLVAIYPVEPGGSAPTITRVDDLTVTVEHAGHGVDDTISFDPANVTADFVVNLAGEGGGTGTINATTGNVGTVNLQ